MTARKASVEATTIAALDERPEPAGTEPVTRMSTGLGMVAGFDWGSRADIVVVYVDRGISGGMMLGIKEALKRGTPVIYRSIPDWQEREITKTAAF